MIDDTEVDARGRHRAEEQETLGKQHLRGVYDPWRDKLLRAVGGCIETVGIIQDELRALREPVQSMEKALRERDDPRSALREIRGELAGIRTRLDSLVAIEKQLGYQGQRLAAVEKRFATLAETTLNAESAAKGRSVRDSIVRNPWDIPAT
jgi:hypothetical protein